ncbi:unnamed protein product [Protopolystoma xenopodis]|uniref:Uncharacterized protein n=1 Tax=Protopolystoma xenopodis TaxID=117903 RepID=A0A448X9S0_9PLAT|nr:unnamed protein product [Protopolystoma xenopodis]
MLHSIEAYRQRRVIKDKAEFIAVSAGRPDPKPRLSIALGMLHYVLGNKAKVTETFRISVLVDSSFIPPIVLEILILHVISACYLLPRTLDNLPYLYSSVTSLCH